MSSRSIDSLSGLCLPLVCALSAAPASAQMTGFVHATDASGVPGDAFAVKQGVYLYAGYDPEDGCSGPGLADGVYYFQVTDPSGALLLSSDELAKRRVVVRNGVLAGSLFASHASLDGPCGSKLVALGPLAWPGGEPGEFRVWLTPMERYQPGAGFHGFLPTESLTDGFLLHAVLPPVLPTIIRGHVFYDYDQDGIYDEGHPLEVPIAGWRVELTSGSLLTVTYTDAAGSFEFLRKRDGTTHTIASIAPPPGYVGEVDGVWLPTSPVGGELVSDMRYVDVDFGVVTLTNSPALARSKGFWHHQGESLLRDCDPVWRAAIDELCLRTDRIETDPNQTQETIFTVSEADSFDVVFGQLAAYLTGPAHGVLAYQLSSQFAAANLNHSCGPLQGTIYINRFGDGVLVSLESMIDGTRELLCDPRSANSGPGGDEEWRQMIMMCQTEWEGMNSTGTNIFDRGAEPGVFPSPY